MTTATSNEFLTIRDWHEAIVGGTDMILRRTSALEYLQLFGGYLREKTIDVYTRQPVPFENIQYQLVDSYNGIDTVRFGNVLCTSVNQTLNDMLADFDNIDKQSLAEGLSRYYYAHGKSFNGLVVKPEYMERFNSIKDWAIEYYDEG
jgi:hypothetical protein